MPRTARMIATALLAFTLSAIGSTAAYAHGPKPDDGPSTSRHAHVTKHAHTITRKSLHHHAAALHRKAKGSAKSHAKVNRSARVGSPAPTSTVTGLVGNLLGPSS